MADFMTFALRFFKLISQPDYVRDRFMSELESEMTSALARHQQMVSVAFDEAGIAELADTMKRSGWGQVDYSEQTHNEEVRMAIKRAGLATVLLLSALVEAQPQSLLDCAKISDDQERLACYDAATTIVEETLEKPRQGSESKRIEARDAAVTAAVIGEQRSIEVRKEAPAQAKFKIKELAFTRRGEIIYVAEDGRRFEKLTQQAGIRSGDEVHLEDGIFGSMFLICEARNSRVKVKAR